MEIHNSEHEHFIEVHAERTVSRRGVGGSKACEGVTCGFSDATDKDEKERKASTRKLLIAVALCIVFMTVEVVGGIKANSLSILTDAAHLLSDVAAFAISLFSIWASGWEANSRQSYGFYRIEILGALVSIQMIWLLAGILVYEAINRLIHGTAEVQGFLMFLVSAFGLVVNIIMAVLLGHDHGHGHDHGSHEHGHDHGSHEHEAHIEGHGKDGKSEKHEHTDNHGVSVTRHHHHDHSKEHAKHGVHHHGHESDVQVQLLKSYSDSEHESHSGGQQKKQRNINVQGAYLHVLGDSIQSIGVMIGGAIIWAKPQWKIVDLICTLIFSVIVLVTTITMCRNIIEVLMESTPREIDPRRLEKGLCEMDEVVAIHELHIWAITVGKVLLACHVKIRPEANADMVLDKVVDYIRTEYNISHVTIQIERE